MALAKNIELIAIEEAILIRDGLMKPTEQLGSFAYWKKQDRVIKRGEKALIQFPVWAKGSRWEDEDGEEHAGGFFMKKTSFWKTSQTISREEAIEMGYKLRGEKK